MCNLNRVDKVRNNLAQKIHEIIVENSQDSLYQSLNPILRDFTGDIDYICKPIYKASICNALERFLHKEGLIYKIVKHASIAPNLSQKYVILQNDKTLSPLQIDINFSVHWRCFSLLPNRPGMDISLDEFQRNYHLIRNYKEFLYKNIISNTVMKELNITRNEFTTITKVNFCLRKFGLNIIAIFYYITNVLKVLRDNAKQTQVFDFYGPDGAGKSSLITKVCNSPSVIPLYDSICVRHTRPGLTPSVSKIINTFNNNKVPTKRSAREINQYSFSKASILILYYSIDYILFRFYISLPFKRRKVLYIYDRFFLEYAYQQAYSKLPQKPILLFYKLFLKSSGIFLISGDADVISKRKNEISIDETEKQLKAMETIGKFLSKSCNVYVIDNTKNPLTDNLRLILDKIYE